MTKIIIVHRLLKSPSTFLLLLAPSTFQQVKLLILFLFVNVQFPQNQLDNRSYILSEKLSYQRCHKGVSFIKNVCYKLNWILYET